MKRWMNRFRRATHLPSAASVERGVLGDRQIHHRRYIRLHSRKALLAMNIRERQDSIFRNAVVKLSFVRVFQKFAVLYHLAIAQENAETMSFHIFVPREPQQIDGAINALVPMV